MGNKEVIQEILSIIPDSVRFVAASKTRTPDEIFEVYSEGIRDFGENKVQELSTKQPLLPSDIRWHQIGHLQTNKVKYIAPFVHLIHSVDSIKLLKEINTQALKNDRVIDCLLQIYIAREETKFGLSDQEAIELIEDFNNSEMKNVRLIGVMGVATNTENENTVRKEFKSLKQTFDQIKDLYFKNDETFREISMGMTSDYHIAVEEGSTIVRIGTAIFGARDYSKK
jgi:hypothetical protein